MTAPAAIATVAAAVAGMMIAAADAEARTYVIAIGYNQPPASAPRADDENDRLPTLRFADDDAAAFYAFVRPLATYAALLTVPDADSRRRFPDTLTEARPPSLAQLRAAVQQIRKHLADDERAGEESVVLFFYSGHGAAPPEGGPPFLTLLDGGLTRERLYDEILAALPARYVHLFIDACHAEAVVRPRDARARVVDLDEKGVAAYAARATLARFPNVGAIVASSSTAVAHEWDAYQGGVFTHEILSGLRGGADVNGDDRVEYSELGAFIAAANREVGDPRARLDAVVSPPRVNPRAPLVDLARLPRIGRLTGRPAHLGALYLEDSSGERLADLRAEENFRVRLAVPAGRTLFVRRRDEEAEIRLDAGQSLAFEELAFHPLTSRNRGALSASLRRGLFAAPFGPVYYRGFTDGNPEVATVPLLPVDVPPPANGGQAPGEVASPGAPPTVRSPSLRLQSPRSPRTTAALFVSSGALAVAAGVFGALTYDAYRDHRDTNIQVTADDADHRFRTYGLASATLLTAAIAAAALALYVGWRSPPHGDR